MAMKEMLSKNNALYMETVFENGKLKDGTFEKALQFQCTTEMAEQVFDAFKIICDKNIDFFVLKNCSDVFIYNEAKNDRSNRLTCEEFDLIKKVLSWMS